MVSEAHVITVSFPQLVLEYPLLWIDVPGRLDILNLGRVLMGEGAGEGGAWWHTTHTPALGWACVVSLQVWRPVRTSFALPLALPGAVRVLEGIARTGLLFLCTGQSPGPCDLEDPDRNLALATLLSLPSPEYIALHFEKGALDALEDCLSSWARRVAQSWTPARLADQTGLSPCAAQRRAIWGAERKCTITVCCHLHLQQEKHPGTGKI
jgi:hypothetical protein